MEENFIGFLFLLTFGGFIVICITIINLISKIQRLQQELEKQKEAINKLHMNVGRYGRFCNDLSDKFQDVLKELKNE